MREAGLEMQNECAEIKLRAERRAGELLGENPDIHPGGDRRPLSHDVIKLSELGISLMQSHRWQMEASIPEKTFEQFIAETKGGWQN